MNVIEFYVEERMLLAQILDSTPSKGIDATRIQQKAFEQVILGFNWRERIERFDVKLREISSLSLDKETKAKCLEVTKSLIETKADALPHWQTSILVSIYDKLV